MSILYRHDELDRKVREKEACIKAAREVSIKIHLADTCNKYMYMYFIIDLHVHVYIWYYEYILVLTQCRLIIREGESWSSW